MTTTPTCTVTGIPLSDRNRAAHGLFAGNCIIRIYKQCNCDATEAKKIVDETCIYLPEVDSYFFNKWSAIGSALARHGFSKEQKKEIYNKYFYKNTECVLPWCKKKVPYELTTKNACCQLHYNQAYRIKHGAAGYDLECKIDGELFNDPKRLSRHIKKLGWTLDQYYTTYIDPAADGKCKWCGKQLEFSTITTGFRNFCHNTPCNVLWHNKHEGRNDCSEAISKGQKESQNMPNQIGYWTKQGYSEEEAKKKVVERQTTNSIEAIAKRHNCSLEEAVEIRKTITRKWQKSMPKMNYSTVSQELFWTLANHLVETQHLSLKDIYFATNNKGEKDTSGKNWEFKLKTTKTCRWLDFYIPTLKKVIEFDGVYWHGNYVRDGKTYTKDDEERDKQIKEVTQCDILHVKEDVYYKNKQQVIDECLNFLLSD